MVSDMSYVDVLEPDMVDNPSHYMQHEKECIVEMVILFGWEAVDGFCKCNAWKYRERAPYKGSQERDDKKADWYVACLEVVKLHDMSELVQWLEDREAANA